MSRRPLAPNAFWVSESLSLMKAMVVLLLFWRTYFKAEVNVRVVKNWFLTRKSRSRCVFNFSKVSLAMRLRFSSTRHRADQSFSFSSPFFFFSRKQGDGLDVELRELTTCHFLLKIKSDKPIRGRCGRLHTECESLIGSPGVDEAQKS